MPTLHRSESGGEHLLQSNVPPSPPSSPGTLKVAVPLKAAHYA